MNDKETSWIRSIVHLQWFREVKDTKCFIQNEIYIYIQKVSA